MANIIRRREREPGELGRPAFLDPFQGWGPLQRMRDFLGWDPFESFLPAAAAPASIPDIEVKETKDALVFTVDLPGVKPDEVDINVTGNRLTLSGKREEEERDESDRFFAYERSYGSFSRSFTLPPGADPDSVKAEFDNGVLSIKVAKRPEVQPKRIQVKGSQPAQQQQQAQKKAA
jgi:HSP20 family protein